MFFARSVSFIGIVPLLIKPTNTPASPPMPVQVSLSMPYWMIGLMAVELRLFNTPAMSVALGSPLGSVISRGCNAMALVPLEFLMLLNILIDRFCVVIAGSKLESAAGTKTLVMSLVEVVPVATAEPPVVVALDLFNTIWTIFPPSEPRPLPNPVEAPWTESSKLVVSAETRLRDITVEPAPETSPTAKPSATFATLMLFTLIPPRVKPVDAEPFALVPSAPADALKDAASFDAVPLVRKLETRPFVKP